MALYDDDELSDFSREFDNGHWIWDDATKALRFISDKSETAVQEVPKTSTLVHPGTINFKDDIDVLEQMRFKRKYQRKPTGETDVIMVQDVKDIALYTAPLSIMSPMLINMLHRPTTERFIRAIILYCQYYLQISEIMAIRQLESLTKIRTPACDKTENEYRENLIDLRLLIAKEYCTILIGASDTKSFHHLGLNKKRNSLTNRDSRLFETLLRMCIQIAWLALGRKCFNIIELELSRLFKTDIFNAVEHLLHSNYIDNMSPQERNVLVGGCVKKQKKLHIRSPLLNAASCPRSVDYRMLALGLVKHNPWELPARLRHLMWIMSLSEQDFGGHGISLGILGLPRKQFDTMLNVLPTVVDDRSCQSQKSSGSQKSLSSQKSQGKKTSQTVDVQKIYPDIQLPMAEDVDDSLMQSFEGQQEEIRPCNETQRRRWQKRYAKLLESLKYSSTKRRDDA